MKGELLMRDRQTGNGQVKNSSPQIYEELTLKDDFMFGKVMQKKELCITMLERLTGNKIEDIKVIEAQKAVKITEDGKGVHYDVYVEDDVEIIYDTEMQNGGKIDIIRILPKRARYYDGLIDLNILEKGKQYDSLKESYVIFICTFDPFGEGFSCYTFKNMCKEKEGLLLNDGRTILFFNTKADKINVTEDVAEFLNYIESNKVSGEYSNRLNEEVSKVRMNKEWRVEYMKTLLHDYDVKTEGMQLGLAMGIAESILEFLEELGEVPNGLKERISEEYDINELRRWLKLTVTVTSVEEFVEKM